MSVPPYGPGSIVELSQEIRSLKYAIDSLTEAIKMNPKTRKALILKELELLG